MTKNTAKKTIVVNLKKSNKETAMKSKKSTKKSESHRGERAAFAFVKAVDAQEGIQSMVLDAVKKVRKGTVAEIAAVAVKLGLTKVTSQNPLTQTHVHLNRLKALKAVKRINVAA